MAVLEQAGYNDSLKITDTLQGSIWSSHNQETNESVIIKVTSRKLHKESMIIYDGKKYNVEENIIKEKEIIKYLTKKPDKKLNNKNIVSYRDFFKSNSNYYFVMENGGHMLFDFVVRVHRYIESDKLDINEWHKFVKIIFKQIINAVEYIHKKNVCHYDISLENLLINDVEVILDSNGKIKFCHDNIIIKLCDFGLAEQFIVNNDDNNDDDDDDKEQKEKKDNKISFESTKKCGKPNYKSPECTNKLSFDAKKNDIWCVGVSLFMMLIGGNMVNKASFNDKSFIQIINGDIDKLLTKWNRIKYVNTQIIDLFNKIFQFQDKRINLQQIKQHQWLQN